MSRTLSHWLVPLLGLLLLPCGCSRETTGPSIGDLMITVLGLEDAPLPGAVVLLDPEVMRSDYSGYLKYSGNNGVAMFKDVESGQHTIQISAHKYYSYQDTIFIEPDSAETYTAHLIRIKGTLILYILDENGTPISGARVGLSDRTRSSHPSFECQETTGIDGEVVFDIYTAGSYALYIEADGFQVYWTVFEIELEQTLTHTASLKAGIEVTSNSDDSGVPALLRETYKEDAALLTMVWVHEQGGSQAQEVELPAETVTKFYESLIRVCNASGLAERDSVVSLYNIHAVLAVPDIVLHEVIVAVDTSMTWVHAWRQGQRLTGYSEIDELMQQYDLQLESFTQSWSTMAFVVLSAPSPLNIKALVVRFEGIDGVIFAEPNGWAGGGNRIVAFDVHSDWVILDYSVGWGDCPSGCIYRRYWRFQAYSDNRVVFLGSLGPPAPPPGQISPD